MKGRLLLLIALLAGPANALEQRQFDYLCSSTQTVENRPITTKLHYRIDLDRNVWCADRCSGRSQSISGVDGVTLVLANDTTPTSRRLISIDRGSGRYTQQTRIQAPGGATISSSMTGQCVMQDFSGIPLERPGVAAIPAAPPPRPPGPPPRPAGPPARPQG
jgi:hypothetical protein